MEPLAREGRSGLELLDELAYALEVENASPEHRKLLKAARALEVYVTNNRAAIPNYGERYRQGKTISTAFVESAVNQAGEQALCEKAADAVDARRRPPAAANPHRGAKRRLARHAARVGAPDEANAPKGGGDRGRDTHCWMPPAQIPAGAIHAPGSHLG
jgi:hypothetical protein